MTQVTLRTTSNIPEDFVQNQFCWEGPPSEAETVRDLLDAFYTAISTTIFPSTIAQNGHIVKTYALPGTAPNYPYYESTFDLAGAQSGDPLPSEVALCLSFQGARVAGEPQARKRGRIFLGPLRTSMNTSGRPTSASVGAILDAAEDLYDGIAAITTGAGWEVWSPANGTSEPIVEAWVDDAFDTQRSRGLAVTSKTVRSFL